MNKFIANLVALFTVFLWGLTFVSTKILLESFTAAEILFLRFTLGYLALCLIPSPRIPLISFKREAIYAAAGLSGVTLYFLLENVALIHTYVANVGVIVATAPFFTALLAWLSLDASRPTLNFYVGFILALSGIILLSHSGQSIQFKLSGDLLALLAAIAWAIYSVLIRKASTYGYPSLSITRRVFFYGLAFMLPLLFSDNFQISVADLFQPINIFNLLFLGLGASALCFATWTFSLKTLGAARASVYIYLVPLIAILSSKIILNEKAGLYALSGAFLTIAGLLISEHDFQKKHTHQE